ncbi:hypothetical protein UAJ10_14995 [Nitrospirillum sp. BR 11164]|uniref:hypothetical protein n=1 Tax=Nitrospirillum sp. BR 11164 TaxID=3104324 RepID=UPI002AFE296A|nr:hypothetical protein [Nitrospirillum sp. BR 11164]MEA1650315.1 hypothetical protein [Nitrospirillum sp. BR 11164]
MNFLKSHVLVNGLMDRVGLDSATSHRQSPLHPVSGVVLGVTALLWGVILAVNAPGQLSYDSVVQLNEGRTATYLSMHPPLMSAVMGLADRVIPGTALYLALSSALFFGALALLINRTARPLPTMALTIAACLTPPVLVYQGIVWKDVLFANLAVLAFATLETFGAPPKGRRYIAYGIACLLAALAALVRQNGFVVILFVALAIGWKEYVRVASAKLAIKALRTVGAVLCAVFFSLGACSLSNGLIRVTAVKQQSVVGLGLLVLAKYDISGIIARETDIDLSILAERGVDTAKFQDAVRQSYTAERLDNPLNPHSSEIAAAGFSHLSPAEITQLWQQLILSHTRAYLAHRMAVFAWLMAPPEPGRCLPVHIGIYGPEDLVHSLGLKEGVRPSDQALYNYSTHYFGGPLMNPTFYVVVAVLLIAYLLWRPIEGSAVMICMLLSALAFVGSYLVIGIACDFRYVYFLVAATISVFLYGAARIPVPNPFKGHPKRGDQANSPRQID